MGLRGGVKLEIRANPLELPEDQATKITRWDHRERHDGEGTVLFELGRLGPGVDRVTWSDITAEAGKIYYYKVDYLIDDGLGNFVDAQFNISPIGVMAGVTDPTPLTAFTVLENDDGTILASWTEASDNNQQGLAFAVYRKNLVPASSVATPVVGTTTKASMTLPATGSIYTHQYAVRQ